MQQLLQLKNGKAKTTTKFQPLHIDICIPKNYKSLQSFSKFLIHKYHFQRKRKSFLKIRKNKCITPHFGISLFLANTAGGRDLHTSVSLTAAACDVFHFSFNYHMCYTNQIHILFSRFNSNDNNTYQAVTLSFLHS